MASEKVIFALQYWFGDAEQAFWLARFISRLEKAPRKDVELWLVPRFDAPAPPADLLVEIGQKFSVQVWRSTRRGQGHPAGCNDLWHALMLEVYRRCLQVRGFAQEYVGVYSLEADNVPLRADWIDKLLAEWGEARAAGSLVMGCYMDAPEPHINGNMFFVPDLFGRVEGLSGCPGHVAWDMFHADKWLAKAYRSRQITNFYRATEVKHGRVYGTKNGAKYAVVHGVKDSSLREVAEKVLFPLQTA